MSIPLTDTFSTPFLFFPFHLFLFFLSTTELEKRVVPFLKLTREARCLDANHAHNGLDACEKRETSQRVSLFNWANSAKTALR